jgi:hypothetical protein
MGAGGDDEASEALARKFKLAYSVIYTGSMVTYLLTICDFCRRIRLDKPYNPQADHAQVDQRWWYQMLAIAISSCAMLVRGKSSGIVAFSAQSTPDVQVGTISPHTPKGVILSTTLVSPSLLALQPALD